MTMTTTQAALMAGASVPEDGTVFTVTVSGTVIGTFDALGDAVRAWNGATYLTGGDGSIGVQTFRNGYMMRDGYILHVHSGITYLNTHIATL